MGFEQYLSLMLHTAKAVAAAAEVAFQRLLALIREGKKPQTALAIVLESFHGAVLLGFKEALGAILQEAISIKTVAAWQVGDIALSQRLYADHQTVAKSVQRLIEQHLQGPQNARKLAKALYEGYDFKADPLNVIKPLPAYLQKEFDRFAAMQLKTPALRAAYLQAIEQAEKGAGQAALQKVLKVAFYERNRYLANRITQTELHRAYTDRQARELMSQARVQYVQIRLSRSHTAKDTDICDYHAKTNLYGLGPGIYPKEKAPKPGFHPFCKCLIAPYLLVPKSAKPVFNPQAEQAFLRSLSPQEARRVAGSQANLEQALQGGRLETIYQKHTDPLYRWGRLGDLSR